MRHALQSMLGRAGFEVVDAVASPGALSLPDAGTDPAVLVANARHGRGLPLFSLVLEARRCWPQLRVVLISGGAADPEEMAMADRFLPKPFSAKALIRAIRELGENGWTPACAPLPHPVQGWPA